MGNFFSSNDLEQNKNGDGHELLSHLQKMVKDGNLRFVDNTLSKLITIKKQNAHNTQISIMVKDAICLGYLELADFLFPHSNTMQIESYLSFSKPPVCSCWAIDELNEEQINLILCKIQDRDEMLLWFSTHPNVKSNHFTWWEIIQHQMIMKQKEKERGGGGGERTEKQLVLIHALFQYVQKHQVFCPHVPQIIVDVLRMKSKSKIKTDILRQMILCLPNTTHSLTKDEAKMIFPFICQRTHFQILSKHWPVFQSLIM